MKKKLMFVLVLLILPIHLMAQDDALSLKTGKASYWRYELVDIHLSLNQGSSLTATALPKVIPASIWKNNQRINTIADINQVNLYAQDNDAWKGQWPIPFNPGLGNFQVRVSVWAEGQTLTAKTEFKIKGREPYKLKPGFSVVTYEGGKNGPGKTPGVDPEDEVSWKNMVYWAEEMGADAFWQCIGQTQVWGKIKEDQYPWSKWTVQLMTKVGQQVKEAGLEYGAWITSFVAIGDKIEDTGYEFTLAYNRKTNTLRHLRYISLGSQKRLDHIIALMKKMNESDVVDYIGLDYMRTDFGGYEFADEFVKDMDVKLPDTWANMEANEKSLWLARLIEVKRDRADREKWEWWRAHKVGLTIEYLMEQVKPTKPVWVFSLGWKTGHQHGQDMLMMLDAGIGFNSPMFYSISRPDYPHMLTTWQSYLNQSKASVMIGQCVDHNLLDKTLNPPSPMEHLIRQEMAIKRLMKSAKHFGLFWHDLNRAFFGARGPYGTKEWIMAGATSFTKVKEANKRYPFEVEVTYPEKLELGERASVKVKITNSSSNTLTALAVSLVDLPRLNRAKKDELIISSLAPGDTSKTQWDFKVTDIFERNGSQQMIAVKIDQENNQYDPYYDMTYCPVTKTTIPLTPTVVPDVTSGETKN